MSLLAVMVVDESRRAWLGININLDKNRFNEDVQNRCYLIDCIPYIPYMLDYSLVAGVGLNLNLCLSSYFIMRKVRYYSRRLFPIETVGDMQKWS